MVAPGADSAPSSASRKPGRRSRLLEHSTERCLISASQRVVPGEPLRAMRFGRVVLQRVGGLGDDEVTHVEVTVLRVASSRGNDVNVDVEWTWRVGVECDVKPRLFTRLSQRRRFHRAAIGRVCVPARLEPSVELRVEQETDPRAVGGHDDSAAGEVGGPLGARERLGEGGREVTHR